MIFYEILIFIVLSSLIFVGLLSELGIKFGKMFYKIFMIILAIIGLILNIINLKNVYETDKIHQERTQMNKKKEGK